MCKLVQIQSNTGEEVLVADIKADTIKKIIMIAQNCNKIDYIYVFGSSVEERCKEQSDIDLAIISNVTRAKLFQSKEYDEFLDTLYDIDIEQDYDILQFNSVEALKTRKDFVCMDILNKGKMIYKR